VISGSLRRPEFQLISAEGRLNVWGSPNADFVSPPDQCLRSAKGSFEASVLSALQVLNRRVVEEMADAQGEGC